MILPTQEIRRRCVSSTPMISPFVERNWVRGMSFGLSSASYDVRIAESVTVHPGEFRLASTMERFDIPDDILMVVHDKSTWARRGLSVFNTILDPGWYGYVTLELVNHGKETLTISAGDPIAQVVCHLLTEPTTQPYSGKYQNQEAGPQSARDEGQTALLNKSVWDVWDLDTSVRIWNVFQHENIKTFGDLVQHTESQLLQYKNFGLISLKEVKAMLAKLDLRLGMPILGPHASIDRVDGLSVRTINMLRHAGMRTLEQVSACTERDLRRHHMTKTSIREINEALVRVGLELKP